MRFLYTRVAAAIGCKRVIATKGCVDAWQSKALRAGAGAHFHLPIVTNVGWEDIHRHIPQYPQVYLKIDCPKIPPSL